MNLSYQLYKISSLIISALSEGKLKEIILQLKNRIEKSSFNSKEDFYSKLKINWDEEFINLLLMGDPTNGKYLI